jgi:hypothetical protein
VCESANTRPHPVGHCVLINPVVQKCGQRAPSAGAPSFTANDALHCGSAVCMHYQAPPLNRQSPSPQPLGCIWWGAANMSQQPGWASNTQLLSCPRMLAAAACHYLQKTPQPPPHASSRRACDTITKCGSGKVRAGPDDAGMMHPDANADHGGADATVGMWRSGMRPSMASVHACANRTACAWPRKRLSLQQHASCGQCLHMHDAAARSHGILVSFAMQGGQCWWCSWCLQLLADGGMRQLALWEWS